MTHYFKNKEGNKVIGVDGDRVTEYDLMFTNGDGSEKGFMEAQNTLVEVPKKVMTKKGLKHKESFMKRVKTLNKSKVTLDTAYEQKKLEEKREKHRLYMIKYNKKYKQDKKHRVEEAIKKVVKDPSERAQVEFEPNLKLIQEFGKHVVDNIILCKRQGYTAEEIDDDKPAHCGHLVFGQIERILEEVKA